MEINKIDSAPVNIHDASNYAREALSERRWVVTTVVGAGMFHITARLKGSLDGYTASIPMLNGGGADLVEPHDLKMAIDAIQSAPSF